MNHKEKCKIMKSIRKKMADKLGVDLHQTECTFEGECRGTCPKCKQEEDLLNHAILSKGALGVATLATAVSLVGCGDDMSSGLMRADYGEEEALSGDVAAPVEDLEYGNMVCDPEYNESEEYDVYEECEECEDETTELPPTSYNDVSKMLNRITVIS
ncbi:MAG: hypothetical protein HUJ71_04240 [Pseudobutyrivibrio sp.]|nr:hypothetical protein [Pseudobutyrivibrio sp.]